MGSSREPWTQNLYVCTGNNRVNMIDPTGHRQRASDGYSVLEEMPMRSWVIRSFIGIFLIALIALGLVQYQRANFARRLETYELVISQYGMPGERAWSWQIHATGEVVKSTHTGGPVVQTDSGRIDQKGMQDVRDALIGLWWLSGRYSGANQAHNHLAIVVRMGTGEEREILLSNALPSPVKHLVDVINANLSSGMQIDYRVW